MANKNKTIKYRTSPLLYFYHYFVVAAFAYVASRYIGIIAYGVGFFIIILMVLNARSMQYEISREEIRFSPSMYDKEEVVVKVKDIVEILVIDRNPWSLLNLGTVMTVIDDEEMQPCIKCVKYPKDLARKIKYAALAAGAQDVSIQIIR